jgi:GAF domain-containing protein/HAMP domain-containing protein
MNSIVVKIVLPFTLLLLAVVGLISGLYYTSTRDSLTETANQTLIAAARTSVSELRSFMGNISSILSLEVQARQELIASYLALAADERSGSLQEEVRAELIRMANQRNVLTYALLDRQGNVLINTLTSPQETNNLPRGFGLGLTDPQYINDILQSGSPYVSPVVFDSVFDQPVIFFGVRVRDLTGNPIGMVIAVYRASILQEEVILNNGLAGVGSYAVIIDENNLRLGHGGDPKALYSFVAPPTSEKIRDLITSRRIPSSALRQSANYYPDFVAGVASITSQQPYFSTKDVTSEDDILSAAAVAMGERSWRLVFLQPQSVFLAPVTTQTQNVVLLASVVALIAVSVLVLLAQALTRPIRSLTQVAEKVAMGDVNVNADVRTGFFAAPEELGTLALAFNVMNTRQRLARDELEARVESRTSDLAKISEQMRYRASQLQAVSEVARAIASEQELERLLPLITRTISERFGFYHVGIFLLDDAKEYAVLRAANSAGGARMLARNHKLRVGQVGIIGFVTAQGQPRLAMDVGKDAFFFDNPDLPLTRSEIGIPLKVRGAVIGALDAQSTQPSAFTQDDVDVLTTLADQVAIAIENARLFSDTRRALMDLQLSQKEYLQEEWANLASTRKELGFRYLQGSLTPITEEVNQREAELWHSLEAQGFVVRHGEKFDPNHPSKGSSNLLVPIKLRGLVIGLIDLHESDPNRDWTEEEISLVGAVAEQVGLALENARLVEESRRRADREHLVSSITSRLRESNDPQAILQTAAVELRQALKARAAQVIIQPREPKEP